MKQQAIQYVALDVHQATLVVSGARMRAEALLAELDVLQELRPKAKAAMLHRSTAPVRLKDPAIDSVPRP
ncbi:MAG TPA: hypothetical protein VEO92_06175, partial [Candidatus Nitrosocosmicus sp.]|nr:hypothetical protein [Candidatus Nitrosocosmicus sp.]